MKKNMGKADRTIRIIIAAVLAVLFFTGGLAVSTTLGIIGAVIGVIFLGTSIVGYCPLYKLVGLSTCPPPKAD